MGANRLQMSNALVLKSTPTDTAIAPRVAGCQRIDSILTVGATLLLELLGAETFADILENATERPDHWQPVNFVTPSLAIALDRVCRAHAARRT